MRVMNPLLGLGFGPRQLQGEAFDTVQHVIVQQPLRRVLAFTGRSIDDVVNCPIVKNEVLGYYKLTRQVERMSEITELERWWNGVG
jgi:hypothetical protein